MTLSLENMNIGKYVGIAVLALLWFWLSWMLLSAEKGFNLKNLFIVIASGIIIFVPLWKKYFQRK